MSEPNVTPYGCWPSPIPPELLTQGAVGLVDVWVTRWGGDALTTIWLESRPSEAGRLQMVAIEPDGSRRDLLPEGFSARSGVHEYGGGAAWVADGVAWFVNWSDQRVYRVGAGGQPVPLTPEPVEPRSVRYADMRCSTNGRFLLAVRETHREGHHVDNDIVVLPAGSAAGGEPVVVFGGADFVAAPRFVAADRIRWVAWDHPNMPWNDTTLYEASFDPLSGVVGPARVLASGASFMQPVGDLVISDAANWWNLWRVEASGAAEAVHPVDAEICGPAWVFGDRHYVVADDGRVAFAVGGLVYVDGVATEVGVAALEQWVVHGTTVTAVAYFVDHDPAIISFDLDDPSGWQIVVAGRALPVARADVSLAQAVEYPTTVGTAHAWYYPPVNSAVVGPAEAAPPLVVMIHGGPTSDAVPFFSLAKQFWTTRGFAVVDVNHRGSTGFGRSFRNLLDGAWGLVDVEDCAAAARHLAATGRADPARVVIRGGSAGGFTVLASLAFTDTYAAGASSYGIADLSALAADTHKFEARYLDRLVGPWPAARAVYEARSPIHHLDGFDRPLIVFQGLNDKVVPPNQSEMIVAALRAKGVECEYHAYVGEGHGFRQAATIVDVLTRELAFYQRILQLD